MVVATKEISSSLFAGCSERVAGSVPVGFEAENLKSFPCYLSLVLVAVLISSLLDVGDGDGDLIVSVMEFVWV